MVAPPPPPSTAARPRPPEPIEVCTVSTPSVSRITCSTGWEASSSASRLVPTGSSCVTWKVFWPDDPRKFVFMNGVRASVPPRMSPATTRVTTPCFSVHSMIGR